MKALTSFKQVFTKNKAKSIISMSMSHIEAVVCASCPENFHDEVRDRCLQYGIQKAFGRADDMVNNLQGNNWIGKWQAKVVMAVVTKVQTLNASRAKIICIQGGRFCDLEMSHQPKLKDAILKELNNPRFIIAVEWLPIIDFRARFPPKNANNNSSNSKVSSLTNGMNSMSINQSMVPNGNSSKKIDSTTNLTCTECKKVFQSMASLVQHQQSTGHSNVPLKQSSAHNSSTSSSTKANETSSTPKGGNKSGNTSNSTKSNLIRSEWVCDDCDRVFASQESLEQHQDALDHSNIEWKCGECGRLFVSEQAFDQHQYATGHRDPTCRTCKREFGSVEALHQHCADTFHQW